MKTLRQIQEQSDARHRAEGKTVQINLDLKYRLKPGEDEKFLEKFEIEEINDKLRAMLTLTTEQSNRSEVESRGKSIKDDYITRLGSFYPRVSAYLLGKA